jgi:hypothetical protein
MHGRARRMWHLGVRLMLRGVVRTAFQFSVVGGVLAIILIFVFLPR